MRKWSRTIIKDQREKAIEAINKEGIIAKEEDQTNRERKQQLRGRSRIEESTCISKRGRYDTKREIWNGYEMTAGFFLAYKFDGN